MKNKIKQNVKHTILALTAAVLVMTGCSAASPPQGSPANNGNNGTPNGPSEKDIAPEPKAPAKVKQTVMLFYSDNDLMKMYRVEREIEADSKEDLPKAALKTWMKGPEQKGLANLMPPEVVVEQIEFRDGIAYVSFSEEIRNANLGSSGELFLIEQITLLMKQFGCDSTQILVRGKAEESLLGHVTTDKPIAAPDPEQYPWFKG